MGRRTDWPRVHDLDTDVLARPPGDGPPAVTLPASHLASRAPYLKARGGVLRSAFGCSGSVVADHGDGVGTPSDGNDVIGTAVCAGLSGRVAQSPADAVRSLSAVVAPKA